MRLHDKVAIVTGAARGIGKAIAHQFLREGAHLVVTDVRREHLDATAQELGELGAILPVTADVTVPKDAERVVRETVNRYGRVDVLVNNAGVAAFEPFLEHTEASWDRTLSVDLKGVFLMGQAVARQMVEQGTPGSIVNMASTNGILGERLLAAYNSAKAGVILLTKTMAIELGEHNIRANAVCPGFILTDLAAESGADESFIREYIKKIPLGRYGRPEDVAQLCAFLASDESSFITGTPIIIDGGQLAEE